MNLEEIISTLLIVKQTNLQGWFCGCNLKDFNLFDFSMLLYLPVALLGTLYICLLVYVHLPCESK